jgi:L-lactate dehydrogenase complex protein LldG
MTSILVQQFVNVFESLRGVAHVVPNWTAAAETAADICRANEATCAALGELPHEFVSTFQQRATHLDAILTEPYAADALPGSIDKAQIGIGVAAYGIAATATLVEEAQDDAIRLVSSLPRTYIGVVEAKTLLPELKDAAPRLRARFAEQSRNCVVSFISGPSRTGDIEMILTLGVHGPEHVYAIIIDPEGTAPA